MAKKSKKSSGINVDLSGVETGGKLIPEGKYNIAVDAATLEESDKGNQYIKFVFEVTEGKSKGNKLFHNCSLQPQALFNLKSVLLALGFEIPAKAFDLDLKELIGLECIGEVSHELYEGKKKPRLTDFISLEGEDSEDDDEGEDSDDEDEKDYSEMSVDELKEECDEQEIEYKKAIKGKKDKEAKKILIELLEEADEDEDDSDSEDEDDQDYEDMDIDELKAECKERGIKFGKKASKEDLIELLEEDDEE